MTEMLEPVQLASNDHPDHDRETCAFCTRKTKPTDETNDLIDEYDEDEAEVHGMEMDGIAHKNNAGKLGQSLEKYKEKQPAYEVSLKGLEGTLPVQTAAHHLIPGNASLKHKSKGESKIYKYLHVNGKATGNVGYNVNNYENGVWLIGNYAIRKSKGLVNWGTGGIGFQKKYNKDPYEYVKAAINSSSRQFHDAHEEYSDRVRQALDAMAMKIGNINDVWCIENKDDRPSDPKELQLTAIVNRLNSISRRLESMLVNPGTNWKTNFYTSGFSEKYIKEEIYGLKKKVFDPT